MSTPIPGQTQVAMKTYDCLVLSGGGAKGAYAAGVSKALDNYRKSHNINSEMCYIGTSSGALNAAMLAAHGPDELIKFWTSIDNKKILGGSNRVSKFQLLKLIWRDRGQSSNGTPFAVFPNVPKHLGKLIRSATLYDKLEALRQKGQIPNLIIAATNYTKGELVSFYFSPLMETFVSVDETAGPEERRLKHLKKIASSDMLVQALLASAAVPIFFPPITIDNDHYIDGGVGNNTPTREAAYFMRFLNETKSGKVGEVICVKQDRPGISQPQEEPLGFIDILTRTLDVDQYVHMEPIVDGWSQINASMEKLEEKNKDFKAWLGTGNTTQSGRSIDEISAKVHDDICRLGGPARRLIIPLLIVQPSGTLGDTINFDPALIKKYINQGYLEALQALQYKGRLSTAIFKSLAQQLPV